MGKVIDLTGQRFGRLTVVERSEDHVSPCGHRQTKWLCKCDCGNSVYVSGSNLKASHVQSCGCLVRDIAKSSHMTHGARRTRLYNIWRGMKKRCRNANDPFFADYGGRGISICNEWEHNFQLFYDWAMANGYKENLTIDRIDNEKGYCPENCRWATMKIQSRNRRGNHLLTFRGITRPIQEWAEIMGIPHTALRKRLKYGWSVEDALTKPIKNKSRAP